MNINETFIQFWKNKFFQLNKWSDDGKEVTPVPIPNTEVKLFSADGSWGFPPVRVGRRFAYFFNALNALKSILCRRGSEVAKRGGL